MTCEDEYSLANFFEDGFVKKQAPSAGSSLASLLTTIRIFRKENEPVITNTSRDQSRRLRKTGCCRRRRRRHHHQRPLPVIHTCVFADRYSALLPAVSFLESHHHRHRTLCHHGSQAATTSMIYVQGTRYPLLCCTCHLDECSLTILPVMVSVEDALKNHAFRRLVSGTCRPALDHENRCSWETKIFRAPDLNCHHHLCYSSTHSWKWIRRHTCV